MNKRFIMAIDQGTTSSRVMLFDRSGDVFDTASREIKQYYPEPGWVEHDPMEYLTSIYDCIEEIFEKNDIGAGSIEAIGITNQRETVILWDKETGRPLHNAIVWQCRRTSEFCERLKEKGLQEEIFKRTGLFIDAYFSASKIRWMKENLDPVSKGIGKNKILAGNVDAWIIWNLSNGKYHVTDYSNASRTQLFNIHTLSWDKDLIEIFGLHESILPQVKPTSGIMAYTGDSGIFDRSLPIAGVAGDQQAALFGQGCFSEGMAKNTYGTALGLMMNIGEKPKASKHGLMTDLAWFIGGKAYYSLEGIIFIGGAAIQWLRDGLNIIDSAAECDKLAKKVKDTGDVYLVPAFTGLCAPYWDMYARGILVGITRGTSKEHICRATEEAIAYQTKDLIESMVADSGSTLDFLRVDGGATKSDFLMQFQADILGIPVQKPRITEMTALGAAYLAGLGVGYWDSLRDLEKHWKPEITYEPSMSEKEVQRLYGGWKRAVERSFGWAKDR